MAIHFANPFLLSCSLRHIARAMVGPFIPDNTQVKEKSLSELQFRQMSHTGDRLLKLLRAEQNFRRVDLSQTTDEAMQQWRDCRSTVNKLVQDYLSAVSAWREGILEEYVTASSPTSPMK